MAASRVPEPGRGIHFAGVWRPPLQPVWRPALHVLAACEKCGLLQFFGDDEQDFYSGCETIVLRGAELPLLQCGEDELGVREGLREDDGEVLKAAGLIDIAADHQGVCVDGAEREVGPHNVEWPWRFQARDIPRLQCLT